MPGDWAPQVVPPQVQFREVDEVAESPGDSSAESIPAESHHFKACVIGEFRRDDSGQTVSGEAQVPQVGEVAQFGRDGAGKVVESEIQGHQVGEVAQLGGHGTRQPVWYRQPGVAVPLATQLDTDDPSGIVGLDPVPAPRQLVGQPVGVVDPVGAVRRGVERHQRRRFRGLGHRHPRAPGRRAGCARRHGGNCGRAVGDRGHQPRSVHRRHRRGAARPGNGRAVHRQSCLVEYPCPQLHRRAQGQEPGGGGRHRHPRRPRRIPGRGFRGPIPAGTGPQCG